MRPTLSHELLDLLVDGPSSFRGIYSSANRLVRAPSSPRFTVEQLWEALTGMEAVGWIRTSFMLPEGDWKEPNVLDREKARREYQEWLPRAPYEQMSVDEVGLWFELQPAGRAEWTRWSKPRQESEEWMVDLDARTSTITVQAVSVERAELTLSEFLERYSRIEVVEGTRVVQPIDGFRLRDGTVIKGGIRLSVIYRETRT